MVTAFNLVSDHISVRLLQSPETQYTKQQAPLQKKLDVGYYVMGWNF